MADLASQPTPIQSVYSWFADDKLLVNRRYQRKLVWTTEEKQKLIESIIKKYPIPAILLAEREGHPGTFEIIDGLQRLHAIMSFIETGYKTTDGKNFDLSQFPTANMRAQSGVFQASTEQPLIEGVEVRNLLDYTLAVSIMRNATEREINDVFDRINTYGHRLSDQERRQSGVQNKFSTLVREISCTVRGDVSRAILPLDEMPSISIDLPLMKHGYDVQAENVFWVNHGVLRSTDLRDSMDEQSIADIAACIIGGDLIDRSKDALDRIYNDEDGEFHRINAALDAYGEKRFSEEFLYCIDQITTTFETGGHTKLRDHIFSKRTTNPFPSIFAVIVFAYHELIIKENKKISNFEMLKQSLKNIADKIDAGRGAGMSEARRRNINLVKGAIRDSFIDNDKAPPIYNSHSIMDIEGIIRRSEAELPSFELKQGVLRLHGIRELDETVMSKVINTICAMANNGKSNGIAGKILIGVADTEAHADRVQELDDIRPVKIGGRYVVGITREMRILQYTPEQYVSMWSTAIRNSTLSEPLKGSVLTSIDYHDFHGLGILIISVPEQNEISSINGKVYWRDVESTEEATGLKIADIAKRF